MTAWGTQLFVSLTPAAFGVFFITHGVKMWTVSNTSPFMDYWMFVFGFFTFFMLLLK